MISASAKNVLIISSQVASSAVGAGASAVCLQGLGVNTIVLPTTLFGQHPGWGAPGGGVIPATQLTDMWNAISKRDIQFDGVLCGYMGDQQHVTLAASIIAQVKERAPDAIIMVDPVMGDNGALYIEPEIAGAIIDTLIPLADYITPNLWEFSVIANLPQNAAASLSPRMIHKTAKAMPPDVIVTSVPVKDAIGVMLITDEGTYLVSHEKFGQVPHGGGDSLAGLILGHLLGGKQPERALAQATASIFDILSGYDAKLDHGELPLVRLQAAIKDAPALKLQKLKT